MNGMVLDGGNNIQSYIGEVAITRGVNAVKEFKVQSGPCRRSTALLVAVL